MKFSFRLLEFFTDRHKLGLDTGPCSAALLLLLGIVWTLATTTVNKMNDLETCYRQIPGLKSFQNGLFTLRD